MTNLLDQNLMVLAQNDEWLAQKLHATTVPQDFVVVTAQNGLPTLIIRGVSFHSRVDPVGEAENMLEAMEKKANTPKAPIAIFGLGMGYHVLSLARSFNRILVIEPNLGLIRLAFSYLDFREALPKLYFKVQLDDFSPSPEMLFMPHAPSARVFRREFDYWSRIFHQDGATGRGGPSRSSGNLPLSIPGLEDLGRGTGQVVRADLEALANTVKLRRGALSPAEIYLLLLQELTTGG